MAEFSNSAVQTVLVGQNVLFNTTVACSRCNNILHRQGSGIVTLKGNTNQCFARYEVSFNGNIAVPDGGTVGPISLAIAIEGEGQYNATMISTPTATAAFNSVSATTTILVPQGCCVTISVENVGTESVSVQNPNLRVQRVC